MTRITPNPVINEAYFKNKEKAEKIAAALQEELIVLISLEPETYATMEDITPIIRKILDEDL